jgi:guanidinoacetate N-methyltransferase
LIIGGWQVMQAWEQPLMDAMAAQISVSGGDILEIGFGMGISADAIVKRGCRSYTVIEAHPLVADRARAWAGQQDVAVTVLEGFWQDIVRDVRDSYDGILFDTFPLSADERQRNHYAFIPHAPRLLRANGLFTCYSDETIDFRAEHIRLLLTHFDEVKLVTVRGLQPPDHCEYWRESHMVIPVAKKLATGPAPHNGDGARGA